MGTKKIGLILKLCVDLLALFAAFIGLELHNVEPVIAILGVSIVVGITTLLVSLLNHLSFLQGLNNIPWKEKYVIVTGIIMFAVMGIIMMYKPELGGLGFLGSVILVGLPFLVELE